jgi:UDP-N-acetylmuramyl pentapeptide synthase
MPRDCVSAFETAEAASAVVSRMLRDGDVVLVKASRVMGLESIVEGIVNPT